MVQRVGGMTTPACDWKRGWVVPQRPQEKGRGEPPDIRMRPISFFLRLRYGYIFLFFLSFLLWYYYYYYYYYLLLTSTTYYSVKLCYTIYITTTILLTTTFNTVLTLLLLYTVQKKKKHWCYRQMFGQPPSLSPGPWEK